jgi:hypothetical protein
MGAAFRLTAFEFGPYPVVLRHASRVLLVLTLCLAVGGHWVALQSVAWASMLVQYSSRAPLSQAVAQTFDGDHPCGLCKGITAAQQSQKKRDAQPAPIKVDLICAMRTITLLPPCAGFLFGTFETRAFKRAHSPPTPPPRPELV